MAVIKKIRGDQVDGSRCRVFFKKCLSQVPRDLMISRILKDPLANLFMNDHERYIQKVYQSFDGLLASSRATWPLSNKSSPQSAAWPGQMN